MDISIKEAFQSALEGDVVDADVLSEVDHEVRRLHRDVNVDAVPDVVAIDITAFIAGMVYQSQFTIEGPSTVTVEMDSELVTQFLLFLSGGRDD